MISYAIIMAGGNGERFWPLSTPERPKQFLDLFGGKALIRHAVDRQEGLIPPERIFVVTADRFVDFAAQPYTLLDSAFLAKNVHVNVMKSVSKSYGVPGIRLGILACGNEEQADCVKRNLSIWNINSYGEFFMQIVEKYGKEYRIACRKIAAERDRFILELRKIPFLEVYPSAANYVLCKVKKPYTAESLCVKLWTEAQCLVKDCSHKKGFEGCEFIRLAVKSPLDNEILFNGVKSL